ncbi:tandem-95 repeat protein [Cellulomonas sp. JZ18]|uniref:Ig-like domain-containing protein n=1 Tax=Cellulomonas sp. JZ18 TaxID=2654191 RepID=UPI0012D41D66|nr:Ig-like domain-containing protein [Cellulomonas sp. JZ18]QGQ20469.1 tandem-95 repeat protein [Cellulomonas sp. JZ18]
MAALVVAALVAPLAVVGLAAPATAAEYRPFARQFSTNTNGDILLAANTLMTCSGTGTACTDARSGASNASNNDLAMTYVDVDGAGGAFNSSSATLTIPEGGTVLWARLYWGGRILTSNTTTANPALRRQVSLQTPGATAYRRVEAPVGQLDEATRDSWGTAYQAYADVTDVVQRAGSGSYTVGDVQSSVGSSNRNEYAGWSLVVAVADPAAPARNLTVFDGFGSVNSGDPLPTFTVSGFVTPPNGDIRTSVGVVTYEGDRGITGDQLRLNGATLGAEGNLSDAANPLSNSFNSSISRNGANVTTRNPAYVNQLGFDADVFSVGKPIIKNGDTSATITLTTSGDQYFPGVVTFATELYDPTLLGNKSVVDLNGAPVRPGDVLEYTVPVRNVGLDTADDSRFFDAIPTGTAYVPGSLRVDGVPVTDEPGDDVGEFVRSPQGHVVAHLGAGATASGGGAIPITPAGADSPHTVTFRVRVGSDVPDGADVVNAAAMTYRGHTTRAAASATTNVLLDPVVATPVPGATAPEAVQDMVTFRPLPGARTTTVAVLANDSDPDRDPLRVVGVTDAAGGTVTVNPDGTLTYAPRDDFAGRDVFTYTVEDPSGLRSTAAVRVTVLNDVPVPAADSATTAGGSAVAVPVLANDRDANGDRLAVRSASTPAGGTTAVQADGTVLYTPRAGFRGQDSFTYVVEDTRGGSDVARVTVTVTNAAPVAVADAYTTNAGTAVDLAVLANDRDPDGDATSAVLVTTPSNGTVQLNPDGTGRYTPRAGFHGTDTFTYRVVDGFTPAAQSAPATVTITVNGAPVARDDSAQVAVGEDSAVVAVLANDTDPEGRPLSVTPASPPAHGDAVVLPDGRVRYTPTTGWAGADTFTYRVTDEGGLTATATVTVTTANTPPVAVDDVASTATSTTARAVPVLANDSDVNVDARVPGQALTVASATADNGATVTRNADGTLDVTPRPGFAGTVTVRYVVADGAGGTATGTLLVDVANAAPTALPDVAATDTGAAVLVDVLVNDSDANTDDTLTLEGVTDPVDADGAVRGRVVVEAGGVRYTPPAGWAGTVTFDYEVGDGRAVSTARVTVTVRNSAPVAEAFTATTGTDAPVRLDVLDHVRDANVPGSDQVLSVTGASADRGATVVRDADGSLTLTPAPGAKGAVTVTYTVSDGVDTATGTVTVTVRNAPPTAPELVRATPTGTAVTVDVLAQVTDANGDDVHVVTYSLPAGPDGDLAGTVQGSTDGLVTFTPAPGFAGRASFRYVVADDEDEVEGWVRVDVANAAPVAASDTARTATGTPVTVDVLANDTDPNIPGTAQRLAASDPVASDGAQAVVEPDGRITVTPAPGHRGPVTVTYTLSDGAGGTATGTLVVTVENAVPVAGDDGPVSTPTGAPVLVDVLANDTDANTRDTLEVVPGTLGVPRDADGTQQGTVAVEGRAVRYTPPAGFAGTVTFTYAVSDGTDAVRGTVTVVVENAPPVAVPDTVRVPAGGTAVVDVVANDTDPNVGATDQRLTVTAVRADRGARVTTGADGRTLTVTPAPGFKGEVAVAYTVADGAGGTAEGVLTVTVENDAPVLPPVRDSVATAHGTPAVVDLLDGATDANGDPLEVVEVGQPVDADGTPRGTVTVVRGVATFAPPAGWSGTVTFRYVVSDGTATTTGTASVTVANGAPVVAPDAATARAGEPVTIDVLANDADPEGGPLTLVGVTQPASGSVAVVGGRLVHTPAPGFTGTVTFTYTVADATGATSTSTVTVQVVAAPVAASTGPLARTGAQPAVLAGAALVLTLLGTGLVLVRRRREAVAR